MTKFRNLQALRNSTALTAALAIGLHVGMVRAQTHAEINVQSQDLFKAIEMLSSQFGVPIAIDKNVVAARRNH